MPVWVFPKVNDMITAQRGGILSIILVVLERISVEATNAAVRTEPDKPPPILNNAPHVVTRQAIFHAEPLKPNGRVLGKSGGKPQAKPN